VRPRRASQPHARTRTSRFYLSCVWSPGECNHHGEYSEYKERRYPQRLPVVCAHAFILWLTSIQRVRNTSNHPTLHTSLSLPEVSFLEPCSRQWSNSCTRIILESKCDSQWNKSASTNVLVAGIAGSPSRRAPAYLPNEYGDWLARYPDYPLIVRPERESRQTGSRRGPTHRYCRATTAAPHVARRGRNRPRSCRRTRCEAQTNAA
jgi:hypothetical protein